MLGLIHAGLHLFYFFLRVAHVVGRAAIGKTKLSDLVLLLLELEREVLVLGIKSHVVDDGFVTANELDEVFGGTTAELRKALGDALRDLDLHDALFLALLFFRGLGTLRDDRQRRLLPHLRRVEALQILRFQARLELGT